MKKEIYCLKVYLSLENGRGKRAHQDSLSVPPENVMNNIAKFLRAYQIDEGSLIWGVVSQMEKPEEVPEGVEEGWLEAMIHLDGHVFQENKVPILEYFLEHEYCPLHGKESGLLSIFSCFRMRLLRYGDKPQLC